jgi:alpha-tubulin suppressor-like RCC1 family protein
VRRSHGRHILVCVSVLLGGCSAVPSELRGAGRSPHPVPAAEARTFTQIAAGFVHTCALDAQGAAHCWGNNDYSQLGADVDAECGGRPCSREPVVVRGGLRFTVLAAGWVHSCGIATDHHTYCWGGGATGRQGYLGNGAVSRSATPVGVLTDSTFTALSLGDGHSCALTASGMAFCWGQNSAGQLGDGTGTDRSTPVPVATSLRFRSLSAGAYHTCGVTFDGAGYCWGDNRWGQLGAGDVPYNSISSSKREPTAVAGDLKFSEIAAGWQHSCAISSTGLAYCWGRNEDARQLGDDSEITHRGTPAPTAGAPPFTTLIAGPLSTCGRTATNELYCWGGNYYGGLGNGDVATGGVGRPVRTRGGPYARVAIGQGHACAIADDRRLWCWGDQSAGQF